MGGKAAFLRVGLLVVFGIAAVIGVVMFLGRNQVRNGQRYETYFRETVQGLEIGAAVKYRGVTLGQVTEIALVSAAYPEAMTSDDVAKASYQLVIVRYEIDPKRLGAVPTASEAVREGLRARLAAQGLTGLAYLELDFVNPRRFPVDTVPWTPTSYHIPSMPSTVSQVQDAATVVLDRLKSIDYVGLAEASRTLLDDLHGQLTGGEVHAALADTAAITAELRKAVEQAHLDEAVGDLRATLASLKQATQGADTKGLVAKAGQALERLNEATRRLPALLAQLQGSVRRVDDGMADVTSGLAPVLRDARAAVTNLRETSEALRRYPASSLFGGPPPREPAR